MTDLCINAERLMERLMVMARIGATEKGGVCRLALSEVDKRGRDLFCAWCKALGCTIRVDAIGNIFARKEGDRPDAPAILIGSHLDSQPTGGKYDGVLGVLGALEVLACFVENNLAMPYALELVSWTNEEGARFAPAMMGSGVFAGVFDLSYAYSRTDQEGVSVEAALESIGYKGLEPVEPYSYRACFELHIEQGPILENEHLPIGVVTGVQGIRWYDLTIWGQEVHAGPTPMTYRDDPVQKALPLLTQIFAIAERFAPVARVTIGALSASPGSRNTVPGAVRATIDMRHPDARTLEHMHEALVAAAAQANAELDEIWYARPVVFDATCIAAVEAGAQHLDVPYRKIISGAGHDAVYLAPITPTAMIFIPCKDGLSHNEAEYAAPEHIAAGANVLFQAVCHLMNESDI